MGVSALSEKSGFPFTENLDLPHNADMLNAAFLRMAAAVRGAAVRCGGTKRKTSIRIGIWITT